MRPIGCFLTVLAVCFLWVPTEGQCSSRKYDSVYKDSLRDYKRKRYDRAFNRLETIVSRRDDSGMVFVVSWDKGSGKPKNWQAAFELLARMYENAEGTPRDLEKARWLYFSVTGNGMKGVWGTNRETGERVYIGYKRTPNSALGLCRLSDTFSDVTKFCKAFERPENASALEDESGVEFALRKYQEYLNTPDENLRLVRALAVGDYAGMSEALEENADPNFEFHKSEVEGGWMVPSDSFFNPVWTAAHRFDTTALDLLLKAGADPNLVPSGYEGRNLIEYTWGWKSNGQNEMKVFDLMPYLSAHGFLLDVEMLEKVRRKANSDDRPQIEQLLPFATEEVISAYRSAEARRLQAIEDREREALLAKQMQEAELFKAKRKIGARLCKVSGSSTLIGYVERLAEEKVQIRISHSYLTRYPGHQDSNFRETIIWDYPGNWTLCD